MALADDCRDTFTYENISSIFMVLSYISIWVGFLLWTFKGTHWATIEFRGVAYTHIGQYSVCDEWHPTDAQLDGPEDAHIDAQVVGLEDASNINSLHMYADQRTFDDDHINKSFIYDSNASLPGYWYNCMDTMEFIAPHNGFYESNVLTSWYCVTVFASAWVVYIAVSCVFVCCGKDNDRVKKRTMVLLGVSCTLTFVLQVLSTVLFAEGLEWYLLNNYHSDEWTLMEGVKYSFEHSYTMTITMACFYAIGSLTSFISVLFMSCDFRSEGHPSASARWGDLEMRSVYGPTVSEFNAYDRRS